MNSIGGLVLDIYDDVNFHVLRESGQIEKVGSLEISDPAKLEDLEDRKFGVVFITKQGSMVRKYPVHDYQHTVLANLYFDQTNEKVSHEARVKAATQIKNASYLFGVKPFESVSKYAADGFAEGNNYVQLRGGRMEKTASPAVISHLLEEYEAHREEYPREEKVALAKEMEKAASRFGFEVPEDLRLYTVKEPEINKEALLQQCALRKDLVASRPEANGLMDEFISKSAEFEPDEAVKLMETFDKEFGLDQYWGRGLEPMGILQEKTAALPSGLSSKETAQFMLENGPMLKTMFGEELLERIQRDPMQINCLPAGAKKFIRGMMDHGPGEKAASYWEAVGETAPYAAMGAGAVAAPVLGVAGFRKLKSMASKAPKAPAAPPKKMLGGLGWKGALGIGAAGYLGWQAKKMFGGS